MIDTNYWLFPGRVISAERVTDSLSLMVILPADVTDDDMKGSSKNGIPGVG